MIRILNILERSAHIIRDFTLIFIDNKIISVNDVNVVFNDTITPSYIPAIPTANL